MSSDVPASRYALSKVPEVTAYFWFIKVLTTGMGETTSDWLAHTADPVIAVAIAGVGLIAALVLQFAVRRYVAGTYWLAVVAVSIFGTMAADILHIGFRIPYVVSSVFFFMILAAVFVGWYRVEQTLSVHSIHTRRQEFFYWAAVLGTFALGTATGDTAASTMHLGYLDSGLLFAAIIAVPALAFWLCRMNEILAFWFAYILTRPLGASFADWMGVSHARGGLGLGTGTVSLALAVLIFGLVAYLSINRTDVERHMA